MSTAQLSITPREDVEYVFPLPHTARAVTAVRRRAEMVVTRWNLPSGVTDDVMLVVSELITNAVVHALPPAALRLSQVRMDGHLAVRVEVTDTGPAAPVALSATAVDPDEHGRGLRIVTALATRCGVGVHSDGTSRWAELAVR